MMWTLIIGDIKHELESAYAAMAKDKTREEEARDWAEATLGDSAHEKR